MEIDEGITGQKAPTGYGRHFYGLGIMTLGVVGLCAGNFLPGQPVPKNFPGRLVLAYAAYAFLFFAGAAVQWRRIAAWSAAALTAYYALVVVLLMNGRGVVAHYTEYGSYSGVAEQFSLAVGGLLIYAAGARIDANRAARLARSGQIAFGICALLFGGAHFVYMNLTAPLVPKWLPPTQTFWGYATGLGFLAAGAAILTGVQARLAAVLLTVMLGSFALLVHFPMLAADFSSVTNWSEAATNLAITGVAWVVPDSPAQQPRQGRRLREV